MHDHARSTYGTEALTGWSFYARFHAWRFS
jgi:hypothetical protein